MIDYRDFLSLMNVGANGLSFIYFDTLSLDGVCFVSLLCTLIRRDDYLK